MAVDRVSYVATTGADAAPCTLAAPCATVNHALAVQANLGPLRRVVVEPGTYAQAIAVTGAAALIVGRAGTSPTPTLMAVDRDVVTISGATLTMRHLTLTGSALGAGGDGVRCTNGAVNLAAVTVQAASDDGVDLRDCDATLDQVTITGSATFGVRALRGALVVRSSRLLGNLNGGLRTAPVDTLTVTGTVIARNGRAGASAVGGAELLANGAVLFDSNTVADNESGSDATRAIICNADGTYALPNNLLTNARAFTTTCPLTHSMSSMLFLPNGTNRPVRTPAYVAPTMGDYHLTAASEARGAGTAPTAMPAPDLDGEARPRGVLDVGADELD